VIRAGSPINHGFPSSKCQAHSNNLKALTMNLSRIFLLGRLFIIQLSLKMKFGLVNGKIWTFWTELLSFRSWELIKSENVSSLWFLMRKSLALNIWVHLLSIWMISSLIRLTNSLLLLYCQLVLIQCVIFLSLDKKGRLSPSRCLLVHVKHKKLSEQLRKLNRPSNGWFCRTVTWLLLSCPL